MATKTVLIDDMDGGEADTTIAFAVNGSSYTLDLSKRNADRFWKALEPYIQAAQEKTKTIKGYTDAIEQRNAVREWARKKGYEIADRGRIPIDIQDAFDAAHRK